MKKINFFYDYRKFSLKLYFNDNNSDTTFNKTLIVDIKENSYNIVSQFLMFYRSFDREYNVYLASLSTFEVYFTKSYSVSFFLSLLQEHVNNCVISKISECDVTI